MNGARDFVQDASVESDQGAPTRGAALALLIGRTLEAMGYELVDVERAGHGLLRVTLDFGAEGLESRAGQRHIGIEDCEAVSRHLTHLLAVEGVDYERLEVGSPGLDRPLRGKRDFQRFAGSMAKVQLYSERDGRRRLRGRLLGVVPGADGSDARVRMALVPAAAGPGARPARGARRQRAAAPAETVEFALAEVEKARLAPDWEFDRQAMHAAASGSLGSGGVEERTVGREP